MKVKNFTWLSLLILLFILTLPCYAQDQFVTFTEFTEEGQYIDLNSDGYFYNVDINSSVDVRFNLNALTQNNGIINSKRSIELHQEINTLNSLLKKMNEDLGGYLENIHNLKEKLDTNPELEENFRKAVKEHGKLIGDIQDFLLVLVGEDKLDKALETPDPLYTELVLLLAEQIDNLKKELDQETSTLLENSEVRAKLWCIHESRDKNPTRIHLKNYDDLQMGSLNRVNKVTFMLTEDEMDHLRKSIEFHDELRQQIEEISKKKIDLDKLINDLKSDLISDITKMEKMLDVQDSKKFLEEIYTELESIADKEKVAEIKSELDLLNNELNWFIEMKDNITVIVKSIIYETNFDNIKSQFAKIEEIKSIIEEVQSEHIPTIDNILEKLDASIDDVSNDLAEKLVTKMDVFLANYLKTWLDRINENEEFIKITDSISALQSLMKKYTITSVSDNVEDSPLAVADKIKEVSISNLQSTSIDIQRTERKENDIFNLYLQLERKGTIISNEQYSFKVRKYGMHSKWVGDLVFAKGNWQEYFQPVTAVSWVIHYKPRQHDNTYSFGNEALQLLNPSLGLNATMFLSDGDMEYGLGVTMTLFDDILQVGYGYNLSKDCKDGQGYYFIGTSLFDLLNKER